jgi:hypothetical protein
LRPPRKKARRIESPIQQDFLDKLVPLLHPDVRVYAIPNGGFRLGLEAIRMKAEGVRSGITDLVFLAPGGKTGWLETKTTARSSRLLPTQEGFMNFCLRSGHLWGVYRTVEEGLAQVRAWGFLRRGC